MDLRDGIRTTGAVRAFTDDVVDHATVHAILDDARFAPSGGNRQPWRVAVVDDTTVRASLAQAMYPVWNEYVAIGATGRTAFSTVGADPDVQSVHVPNQLLDGIASVPVVLAVAVDLRMVAMMDAVLDRPTVTGGASIYPFCWNIVLAARARGLGGVITTFASRVEPVTAPLLHLPEHHALAAVIFLGVPVHQPTRLSRRPVHQFTTLDHFDGPPLDV